MTNDRSSTALRTLQRALGVEIDLRPLPQGSPLQQHLKEEIRQVAAGTRMRVGRLDLLLLRRGLFLAGSYRSNADPQEPRLHGPHLGQGRSPAFAIRLLQPALYVRSGREGLSQPARPREFESRRIYGTVPVPHCCATFSAPACKVQLLHMQYAACRSRAEADEVSLASAFLVGAAPVLCVLAIIFFPFLP